MKVTPEMIDALLASGLTAEQALLAVKALSSVRSNEAIRKARSRANVTDSHGQSRTRRDNPDKPPAPLSPLDKENPPRPLKEINPPYTPQTPRRGSRLSDDFEPDIGFATSNGLSPSQAQTEVAKFRNYWQAKAGKDAAKLDWPATWRNWVLQAVERLPNARGSPPRPLRGVEALRLDFMAELESDGRREAEEGVIAGNVRRLSVDGR